ncbi:MAG: hypothetical protein AAFY17_06490 [Cyanobacteria bacterium J06642_11]
MQTPGEELVGEYLRHIRGCEFVQYNLQTSHVQGEVDVIGINIATQTLYVCEVAVHLVTRLQYVKNKRPDNVDRFINKFTKDIQYARSAFPEYEHIFMLWSPIVKQRANSQYDQVGHVKAIQRSIKTTFDVDLNLIINGKFQQCIAELRAFAKQQGAAFTSPIMRFLQIEERLLQHLQ